MNGYLGNVKQTHVKSEQKGSTDEKNRLSFYDYDYHLSIYLSIYGADGGLAAPTVHTIGKLNHNFIRTV